MKCSSRPPPDANRKGMLSCAENPYSGCKKYQLDIRQRAFNSHCNSEQKNIITLTMIYGYGNLCGGALTSLWRWSIPHTANIGVALSCCPSPLAIMVSWTP
jgi:hypothetical protein